MAPSPKGVEVRVGLLVLAALGIFAFGSLWILGSFPLGPGRKSYQVAMTSSGGVRQGDRVRISGVEVGRIDAVKLHPGADWPVVFTVTLDSSIRVTEQASARIATEGLLGANYLQIDVGPPSAPELPTGSMIYQGAASGIDGALAGLDALTGRAVELLDQVSGVLDTIVGDMDPLLKRASRLLSDENLESFSGTLAGMNELVAENRPVINSMLERLDSLAAQLEESTADLPQVSERVTALMADLQAGLGENGERLAALLEAAEGAATSAGKTFDTLNDNRQVVESSLQDLQATMANLKEFSRQLRERPSSLVRNYRPRDRRPGDGAGEP